MATRQTESDVRSVIETARLRLEPWDDSHFERFAHFMRDPDVIRYIRPEPLDLERAIEQHERSLEEWEIYGFGKRAMIEAETDEWLGFVELSLVGPEQGIARRRRRARILRRAVTLGRGHRDRGGARHPRRGVRPLRGSTS